MIQDYDSDHDAISNLPAENRMPFQSLNNLSRFSAAFLVLGCVVAQTAGATTYANIAAFI